jgi:hypothetical protein
MASFTDPDGNVLGFFGAGAGTSHSSVRSAPGAAPSIGSPTTSRQGAISTPGGLPVWATSRSPLRPPRSLRSDRQPDAVGVVQEDLQPAGPRLTTKGHRTPQAARLAQRAYTRRMAGDDLFGRVQTGVLAALHLSAWHPHREVGGAGYCGATG